jgi:hypothetical protein
MQTPITPDVLGRVGISDSLISRTLQALTALDLINDDGMPTDTFEGLRLSSESEYKQRLQEWLRSVYADVFGYVDPLQDDEVKIRDAFRTYKPMGQQSRMVSLFIGLCDAAGMRPAVSIERKPKPSTPTKRKAAPSNNAKPAVIKRKTGSSTGGGLPAALDGLMQSLPDEGNGWTKEQHDKFLVTFGAVLSFCYPIVEQSQDNSSDENQDDR